MRISDWSSDVALPILQQNPRRGTARHVVPRVALPDQEARTRRGIASQRDQLASSGPRDALCYTPTQIGKPPRQTRLRSGDANASTGFAEQQPSGGFIVQSTSLARAAPRRPHISSPGAAPTADRKSGV